MKDREHEKAHYPSRRARAQVPPHVAARLEGKVKNAGTKPKRKPKKAGK